MELNMQNAGIFNHFIYLLIETKIDETFLLHILLLTRTLVVESYLNDLVWPFSKKTFNTFAIGGTCKSPNENADCCNQSKFYLFSFIE